MTANNDGTNEENIVTNLNDITDGWNNTFLMNPSVHVSVPKALFTAGGINMADMNFSFYDSTDENGNFSTSDAASDDFAEFLRRKEEIESQIRSTLFEHYDNPVVITLSVLYALSFVGGLLGNIAVIHVFTMRKMRLPMNTFLVNLAICDITVVLLCMPFTAMQALYSDWIYGDAWCKMMNYFQGVSIFASILTLSVISADRFHAVRHPLQARSFVTHARAIKIIVVLYIVTASVMIPVLLTRYKHETDPVIPALSVTIRSCREHWPSMALKHAYNFALMSILYVCPIIFISVGYVRIGTDLWRNDSSLHATNGASLTGNVARQVTERRKVAKMLFVIAILFALSWLPFNVLLVTVDFLPDSFIKKNGQIVRYIFDYSLWLGHANSAVNPICYCVMSQSFKRAFKQEFRRYCRRKRFTRNESVASRSNSMTVTTTYARAKQTSCIYKTQMAAYNLMNMTRGSDKNADVRATCAKQQVADSKV